MKLSQPQTTKSWVIQSIYCPGLWFIGLWFIPLNRSSSDPADLPQGNSDHFRQAIGFEEARDGPRLGSRRYFQPTVRRISGLFKAARCRAEHIV